MNTADIKPSFVMSVYSGKANKCCCGCSGKHTYAKAHQEAGSKDRGYEVGDEECNDRTVTLILRKIQAAQAEGLRLNVCPGKEGGFVSHVSVDVGNRVYIAYMRPGVGYDWEKADA